MTNTRQWLNKGIPACLLLSATKAQAAGFPQLDQSWYPNQLFWLVVTFSVLYVIVSRVITPNVGAVLNVREAAIDDAIREAERAKHTAESTRSGMESANVEARNKASAVLAKAQAETSKEALDALHKIDHDIARKLTQADTRIEESKAKALKAINTATGDLVEAMVTKLLGRSVDEPTIEAAISGATKKK